MDYNIMIYDTISHKQTASNGQFSQTFHTFTVPGSVSDYTYTKTTTLETEVFANTGCCLIEGRSHWASDSGG